MKRWLAAALCLLLLSACRAEKEDGFSGKENQASAAGLMGEGTAGMEESGAMRENREQEKYERDFLRMLSELEGVRPGSAGSGLRAYSAACAVLDFAERHGEGGAEWLKARLEKYLEEEGGSEAGPLWEGWRAASGAAQELLEKGTRELKDILSDAGNPNQYESYRWESYGPVAAIFEQQLGAVGEEG